LGRAVGVPVFAVISIGVAFQPYQSDDFWLAPTFVALTNTSIDSSL
jgi:hypothetical protein